MLRKFGILILASMISSIAVGFQQPANSSDAQRRKDVYAIYSAMLSYRSGLDNNLYVIASTTKLAIPNSPAASAANAPFPCIAPPANYESRWTEVLADFKARNDHPSSLERELNIPNPYVYIELDEAAVFSAPDARYPGAKEVFTLSDVYFNKDRTLALTGIASKCGRMCYSAHWEIYEKVADGAWKVIRPARNCYTVA